MRRNVRKKFEKLSVRNAKKCEKLSARNAKKCPEKYENCP